MPATARLLIGRDEELEVIGRLLDDRARLPGVVLMHGEAGIGKTSVWLAGVDVAAEHGYLLLSVRSVDPRVTVVRAADPVTDCAVETMPTRERRPCGAAPSGR